MRVRSSSRYCMSLGVVDLAMKWSEKDNNEGKMRNGTGLF